jgi:hypothetical protein
VAQVAGLRASVWAARPPARPPSVGGLRPGLGPQNIPATPQPRKGFLAPPENVVSHALEYPHWEQWRHPASSFKGMPSRQLIE